MTPRAVDGYNLETPYTYKFFSPLAPSAINFATQLRGFSPVPLGRSFTYFELGCGNALTSTLLAAANPSGAFYANDINPDHIKNAQDYAQVTGTENVTFLKKSFAELIRLDLPPFDFIAMHGIYTWVSAENRRHIIKFIKKFLKPGGLVYVSYNTDAGHAAFSPLRRVMYEISERASGQLRERIGQAFQFAALLEEKNAPPFRDNAKLLNFVKAQRGKDWHYLAHEFFNRDWTLFDMADVAGEMAEAGLSFAAHGNVIDNYPHFVLPEPMLGIYQGIKDPLLAQSVLDLLCNRHFRSDVYHLGTSALSMEKNIERFSEARFLLTRPLADCTMSSKVPSGTVTLKESIYAPLLAQLANGPATPQELHGALKKKPEFKFYTLDQLIRDIGKLAAIGYISPALPERGEKKRRLSTGRFNEAVLRGNLTSERHDFLASPVLGSAVKVKRVDRLFVAAMLAGRTDLESYAWEYFSSRKQWLVVKGKQLEGRGEHIKELAGRAENFRATLLDSYRAFGLIGSDAA